MTATAMQLEAIESTVLTVSDVHCLHCAACLEETIADVPGVVEVSVEGTTGKVNLTYRPDILRITDLIEAMQGLGLCTS